MKIKLSNKTKDRLSIINFLIFILVWILCVYFCYKLFTGNPTFDNLFISLCIFIFDIPILICLWIITDHKITGRALLKQVPRKSACPNCPMNRKYHCGGCGDDGVPFSGI